MDGRMDDKLGCVLKLTFIRKPLSAILYIKKKTLSKLRSFGDLRDLGDISEPSFLMAYRDVYDPRYDPCMTCPLPLTVIDDNQRYKDMTRDETKDDKRQQGFRAAKGNAARLNTNNK
ncbi:uncharacterized protein LOC113662071 isoform X2 [Tachysurus fulvidraco]|uniref:uncharacterized protein LOC113662071 isoform X2 n=1 Tax=Tachysurus fulvidraco TaxID=1234273 RepID=UPI001FEF8790|nr:uncharacterized protein LOC113662071 isoform X2 [Tachysurus fulvidraco]